VETEEMEEKEAVVTEGMVGKALGRFRKSR